MKWCMVAVMAVSFLIGGVSHAQTDDFDLDALLGDFDSPPEQVDDTVEAAEDPFAEEAVEAAVDPFADAADWDAAPEEEMADDFGLDVDVDEAPVADLDWDAPADDVAAVAATDDWDADDDWAAPAPAADDFDLGLDLDDGEDAIADVDDFLGDFLTDDEPMAATPAVASDPFDSFDSFAPVAMPEEDDFEMGFYDDEDVLAEESFAPVATPTPTVGARRLPPEAVQGIARETAQQEEVRRQAAEASARRSAESGFRALGDGNFVAAENAFASALSNLPDRPQTADLRQQITWGLAEARYLRARGMVQRQERLADARKLIDSALKGVPDHRGAQALDRRLTRLEAQMAQPKSPAMQPATIEKAKTISQMFDEARQWYMVKDYDRASALFEQILLRDPYHRSSMRYLRKIEEDKFKLATVERQARVQGMLTDVRRSWSPPIRAQIEIPAELEGAPGRDPRPEAEQLIDKMQRIIIPEVQFRQANISDVVNFLVDASIAADAEGEGVNIILNLGAGTAGPAAPAPAAAPAFDDDWGDFGGFDSPAPSASIPGIRDITLNLRRVNMLDAIKYITEVAGLKYRIEGRAVMITPLDAPVGNIITRMYPVQPSFMDVVIERSARDDRDSEFQSIGSQVSVTRSDVKEFFERTGVRFPAGASITYNATISQLIVANTADNLETFERILQQINVVPNQVEIEARFIEVDQTDLEELGLQWILNDNWEVATRNDGSGGRLQVNANRFGASQGLRFFGQDTGTLAINPVSSVARSSSQSMLGGILSASSVLTNPEVSIVLQALSQHGGTDLLSAPRVTTRSGVNAQIQVVKEIIYPTEFSVTQPSVDSDGNVTMGPISEPGQFETRETGVILNVTPTVGPDGYTIDLVMAPEVAELVDWIQYGSVIEIPSEFGSQLWTYNMPMPVFTSRNVTTSIVIWDGQTVVMGGLIREELTTIKDKIPLLGDIPLLGRLFRSEGQYSRKMNLLIFVTARLVDPAGRPIHREGVMAMPGAGVDTELDSMM